MRLWTLHWTKSKNVTRANLPSSSHYVDKWWRFQCLHFTLFGTLYPRSGERDFQVKTRAQVEDWVRDTLS